MVWAECGECRARRSWLSSPWQNVALMVIVFRGLFASVGLGDRQPSQPIHEERYMVSWGFRRRCTFASMGGRWHGASDLAVLRAGTMSLRVLGAMGGLCRRLAQGMCVGVNGLAWQSVGRHPQEPQYFGNDLPLCAVRSRRGRVVHSWVASLSEQFRIVCPSPIGGVVSTGPSPQY